ncbi:MAG TPA: helix-turn-helix domain-containing protein, partial [bacterium]|nr:helix-turn-helix domain-containing protein [bacterium]
LPTPIAALPPQNQPADHDPASPLAIPETAKELRKAKKMLKDKFYGELEKNFVLQVLKKSNGNITHAARLAGMQRPNFHALMRKHNITNK